MPLPALQQLLRTTPTTAQLANRAVIYVSGSQSSEFLNGLLATVVPNVGRGPSYSAVLHAQGRILHDIFVYPKKNDKGHDGYLIEHDSRPSEASPLLSYFKQHVLRSKVKVQDVTDEYDVWAIWGHGCMERWGGPGKWNLAKSGVVEPVWNDDVWPWSSGSSGLSMRDRRAPGMGRRILSRKSDKPDGTSNHDIVESIEYTKHRILHGVPEGNDDMVPLHAFPMESNLDIMGALDFRKGCYVGQELTVRTYHTGVLRKRILPVQLQSPTGSFTNLTTLPQCDIKPSYKTEVNASRPRLRGTGKLLSNVHGIGLALMRLEHVDLADKGIVKFQVEIDDDGKSKILDVSHWWPSWWPTREVDS